MPVLPRIKRRTAPTVLSQSTHRVTDCTCCFTAPCSLTLTPSQTHSLSFYLSYTRAHTQPDTLPYSTPSQLRVSSSRPPAPYSTPAGRHQALQGAYSTLGIYTGRSRVAHFNAFLDYIWEKEDLLLKKKTNSFWETIRSETCNTKGCRKSQEEDEEGSNFAKCLGQRYHPKSQRHPKDWLDLSGTY